MHYWRKDGKFLIQGIKHELGLVDIFYKPYFRMKCKKTELRNRSSVNQINNN